MSVVRLDRAAQAMDSLDRFALDADAFIADIANQPTEHLQAVLDRAQHVVGVAWRLETACRAELVRRVQEMPAITEGLNALADEIGISRRELYREKALFDVFLAPDAPPPPCFVDDKAFFQEALRAPDPHGALALIADRKVVNPHYTVQRARQDVELLRMQQRAPHMNALLKTGRHALIVADVPWDREDMRPSDLTLSELAAIPVAAVAEADCRLLLWTYNALLEHALRLVKNWGFVYRGNYALALNPRDAKVTRDDHVLLIEAVRGDPPPWQMRLATILPEERDGIFPTLVYFTQKYCMSRPRLALWSGPLGADWDHWLGTSPA